MTPKVKIFESISGFIDGTSNYVSWPNFVKIGRCEVAERSRGLPNKKLGLRGTRPSPHFGKNGPIAPKIPWTLSPFFLSTCTEFSSDRLRFAGLIPERLFFSRPKKSIQIGFQPTTYKLKQTTDEISPSKVVVLVTCTCTEYLLPRELLLHPQNMWCACF